MATPTLEGGKRCRPHTSLAKRCQKPVKSNAHSPGSRTKSPLGRRSRPVITGENTAAKNALGSTSNELARQRGAQASSGRAPRDAARLSLTVLGDGGLRLTGAEGRLGATGEHQDGTAGGLDQVYRGGADGNLTDARLGTGVDHDQVGVLTGDRDDLGTEGAGERLGGLAGTAGTVAHGAESAGRPTPLGAD